MLTLKNKLDLLIFLKRYPVRADLDAFEDVQALRLREVDLTIFSVDRTLESIIAPISGDLRSVASSAEENQWNILVLEVQPWHGRWVLMPCDGEIEIYTMTKASCFLKITHRYGVSFLLLEGILCHDLVNLLSGWKQKGERLGMLDGRQIQVVFIIPGTFCVHEDQPSIQAGSQLALYRGTI